jgi:predicted dehydrogenase
MSTRRSFLQKVASTALVLNSIAPSRGQSQTQPLFDHRSDERPLRVAIMGLGSYANRVAEAMQDCKKAILTGVISGTPSKISDWQKKYNIPSKNCYNYHDFDNIRTNPDVDVVYVITPNALHKEQVIRIARAGKHVICEKPMATTANDAMEMLDACKKANVKLLVGYRMHFEPKTLTVIQMRKAGEFGKILFFEGLSGFKIGDPKQWRLDRSLSGGGALMDIGIYSINGARYMIGNEPVWVTAQETKTDPVKFKEGVDETILFQLGFPDGAVASCLSTYTMNNLDRFFLNGEKGYAILQPATGYGPIMGNTHLGEINFQHVAHQTIQMDEMADILIRDKKPIVAVDGEEGLKDIQLIEAIYKAVRSGEKVMIKR